mmetsp:Transcript_26744/g.61610  ORF Transcript_26744/g.61610 Transcript_26744/m.61610 type:complete len:95 (+) Transcript_26744:137-421(+)
MPPNSSVHEFHVSNPSEASRHKRIGCALVLGSALFWMSILYWTVFSKFMPATESVVLDWMREDTFFCHLLAVLPPSLLLFRYWSWVSMEVFTKV